MCRPTPPASSPPLRPISPNLPPVEVFRRVLSLWCPQCGGRMPRFDVYRIPVPVRSGTHDMDPSVRVSLARSERSGTAGPRAPGRESISRAAVPLPRYFNCRPLAEIRACLELVARKRLELPARRMRCPRFVWLARGYGTPGQRIANTAMRAEISAQSCIPDHRSHRGLKLFQAQFAHLT